MAPPAGEPRPVEGVRALTARVTTPGARSFATNGLLVLAIFYTLYFGRVFFLPIVLAFLLNLILRPVVRRLGRVGLPPGAAAGVIVLLMVGGSYAGIGQLVQPAAAWLEDAPATLRRVEKRVRRMTAPMEQVSRAAQQVERLTTDAKTVQVRTGTMQTRLLADAQSLVTTVIVTIILLYFMLASGREFLDKLVHVMPRFSDKKRVVAITRRVEQDVSIYLGTVTLINATLGAAVGGAMWALNMPNPALWAVLAALLNFVPYLGALSMLGVVTAVSLITFDAPSQVLLPPLAYLLLTSTEGYFVTPMLLGRRLPLHPIVILIGLLFWTWLWGIPGAVMAVPLLTSFKIICDQTRPLRPIGLFLGRSSC